MCSEEFQNANEAFVDASRNLQLARREYEAAMSRLWVLKVQRFVRRLRESESTPLATT